MTTRMTMKLYKEQRFCCLSAKFFLFVLVVFLAKKEVARSNDKSRHKNNSNRNNNNNNSSSATKCGSLVGRQVESAVPVVRIQKRQQRCQSSRSHRTYRPIHHDKRRNVPRILWNKMPWVLGSVMSAYCCTASQYCNLRSTKYRYADGTTRNLFHDLKIGKILSGPPPQKNDWLAGAGFGCYRAN